MRGSLDPATRLRYDITGDIAVIRTATPDAKLHAADSIMKRNKHVKVVLFQSSPVQGKFRLCKLSLVAGEDRTSTVHRENGCRFHVDLAQVHFSPRLVHERRLVAKSVRPCETVLNMFGGIGSFSIEIAKEQATTRVFTVDINPEATKLCLRNILMNRLRGRVTAVLADAKEAATLLFRNGMDRVLLPLPEVSREYLSVAILVLKRQGTIQYYDFVEVRKGERAVEKICAEIGPQVDENGIDLRRGRVVKSVSPRRYLVSLELRRSEYVGEKA